MDQYKAVKGSILTDDEAQVYGDRISEIIEKAGRLITSEEVLDDARNPESPLHGFFEWDIQEAARKHWISQAGYLLRSINIKYRENDTEMEIRAFVKADFKTPDGIETGYAPIMRILTDDDLRRQFIAQALRELDIWRNRYEKYAELSDIVTAIEQAKQMFLPVVA